MQNESVCGTRVGFYVKRLVVERYGSDGRCVGEFDTNVKFRLRADLDQWLAEHGIMVLSERWDGEEVDDAEESVSQNRAGQ